MKVISFKVNDEIYNILRSKTKDFRKMFEPIAIELAKNKAYTRRIQSSFIDIYLDIYEIQKNIVKIMEELRKDTF